MDQIDELFINRYAYSDDKYIETIRPRHTLDTDAWLCDLKSYTKQYITSFNAREEGWLNMIKEEIAKLEVA